MTKGNRFKYINTNETFTEALGVEVSPNLRNTRNKYPAKYVNISIIVSLYFIIKNIHN